VAQGSAAHLTTPPPRGLDGVVAARTRLSHVDGLAGQLIIAGYELKDLAGHVSFEAAAHLLWRGALPGAAELDALRREMAARRAVPAEALRVVRAAAKAPPIDALRMACATLSLDLADPNGISPAADLEAATMLTARFPTLIAAHARLGAGQEPIAPTCPTRRTSSTWCTARSRTRSPRGRSTPTGSR
jgi:citrate synthase